MSSPPPRSRRGAHRTGRSVAPALMPSVLAVVAVTALVTSLAVWRGEDPGQPRAAASTTTPGTATREALSTAPSSTPVDEQGPPPPSPAASRRRPSGRQRCATSRSWSSTRPPAAVWPGRSPTSCAGRAGRSRRSATSAASSRRPPSTTRGRGGGGAGRCREPADRPADPAAVRQPVDDPPHRRRHRLLPRLTVGPRTTVRQVTRQPWSDWSGQQACAPVRVSRPRSEDELSDAVRRAAAERLVVRPVGSGHSFSPVCVTDDVQLDVSRLDGTVRGRRRVRRCHRSRRPDAAPAVCSSCMPGVAR